MTTIMMMDIEVEVEGYQILAVQVVDVTIRRER